MHQNPFLAGPVTTSGNISGKLWTSPTNFLWDPQNRAQISCTSTLGITAACYRTENAQIPKSAAGSAGKSAGKKGTAGGTAGSSCFYGKAEKRHCSQQSPQHSSFSRHSSQHSPRHFWGFGHFQSCSRRPWYLKLSPPPGQLGKWNQSSVSQKTCAQEGLWMQWPTNSMAWCPKQSRTPIWHFVCDSQISSSIRVLQSLSLFPLSLLPTSSVVVAKLQRSGHSRKARMLHLIDKCFQLWS